MTQRWGRSLSVGRNQFQRIHVLVQRMFVVLARNIYNCMHQRYQVPDRCVRAWRACGGSKLGMAMAVGGMAIEELPPHSCH
jgi:hypothetical protein